MTSLDLIIAVDGFSSTGKSSFAKLVAKSMHLLYLDSGALYRAVTLFAQEEHLISPSGVVAPTLQKALQTLDVHFDAQGRTCIGVRCVEKQIRSLEVSSQVSPVSALPYVREFVDEKLHEFGRNGGVEMAKKYDMPLLGQIPIVQSIRECGDAGEPAALSSRPDGVAFLELAQKLAEESEKER